MGLRRSLECWVFTTQYISHFGSVRVHLFRIVKATAFKTLPHVQQVKFGVVVVSWQAALLLLGMLLLRWRTSSKTTFAWIRRGLHTSSNELEVMAKITTFLVVFVAIFCGWPCLLHFMAGEARYSSSPFHLFDKMDINSSP